ncbi:hypothetical protein P280DRAFT_478666 [Massarina eburnea CBS 473.64]|uniref:Uncharacterized protein n=1 Tax=Massarina eburnea CBS 473.64 TaxID=1395130 RepID=A0A6A6S4E1_9PLEO|nr:hypothetical protein P280DRAFT_478666 [Massarina eburnea CBS 473.64]
MIIGKALESADLAIDKETVVPHLFMLNKAKASATEVVDSETLRLRIADGDNRYWCLQGVMFVGSSHMNVKAKLGAIEDFKHETYLEDLVNGIIIDTVAEECCSSCHWEL